MVAETSKIFSGTKRNALGKSETFATRVSFSGETGRESPPYTLPKRAVLWLYAFEALTLEKNALMQSVVTSKIF